VKEFPAAELGGCVLAS